MRTDFEIVDRIKEIESIDFLGLEESYLVSYLPVDLASVYVRVDNPNEWTVIPRDHANVLTEMLNYMPFAWSKANEFRSLSALRSMSYYRTWIWLVGGDVSIFDNYEYYGKDILRKICDTYGWDSKQWDDGVRLNSEPNE
jgi:hypothetical protein